MNIGKTVEYKNKVLISNINRKLCSNRNTNKAEVYNEKLLKSWFHAAQQKAHGIKKQRL